METLMWFADASRVIVIAGSLLTLLFFLLGHLWKTAELHKPPMPKRTLAFETLEVNDHIRPAVAVSWFWNPPFYPGFAIDMTIIAEPVFRFPYGVDPMRDMLLDLRHQLWDEVPPSWSRFL